MNINLRPSEKRGHTQFDWLDSKHTYSFGDFYDPRAMGFRSLRVINDDTVAGGGGFPTHPHSNMEIISYVLSGALTHRDSLGTDHTIHAGEVQMMSAGSGIRHSEFNGSQTEPVHFLQIWIVPKEKNVAPRYSEWKSSDPKAKEQVITDLADVSLNLVRLGAGESLALNGDNYIHVTKGQIALGGASLNAGDGAEITGAAGEKLVVGKDVEMLLFRFR